MKNVSNCLLVILKAVIIQELPPSVSYLVLHWTFKNNSLFEASCTGTSKRERMCCAGSELQVQPVRHLRGACLVTVL